MCTDVWWCVVDMWRVDLSIMGVYGGVVVVFGGAVW